MTGPVRKNLHFFSITISKPKWAVVFCLLIAGFLLCAPMLSAEDGRAEREAMARELSLVHNTPNPFNAHTTIKYKLLRPADVQVDIFDLAGRHVVKLLDEYQNEGENFAIWKTESQPSGTYFCRLEVEGITAFRKMSMVK